MGKSKRRNTNRFEDAPVKRSNKNNNRRQNRNSGVQQAVQEMDTEMYEMIQEYNEMCAHIFQGCE